MTRKPGTKVVHAGLQPAAAGEPILAGPVFAAPFHLPGDPHAAPYGYTREGNPTWAAYEDAIAELEGARYATLFASGMAATAAVLLSTLKPGDVFVAPTDGYPVLRRLANGHLAERGVETRFVPTCADWFSQLDGARLVWMETPSNPALDICDVAAIAAAAHEAGAIVALDSTLPTPLGQSALALGCDLAMVSDTKAMTGHSDVLMGHVATNDPDLAHQIRNFREEAGAIPGPMEAWLAHRSLATLDVRLERQCRNAQAIAEALDARDDVKDVRYPGLPSHPQHELAKRQMRNFGMVVSFTLATAERAQGFIDASELVIDATSFGGVHTTAERRARWGQGDAIPEGFIRMSVGIEDVEDLLADIGAALDESS